MRHCRPDGKPLVGAHLVLVAGAFVLPHPDKMAKGGEDWFFVSDTMRAIGVADGVGGWVSDGRHSGCSPSMLTHCIDYISNWLFCKLGSCARVGAHCIT